MGQGLILRAFLLLSMVCGANSDCVSSIFQEVAVFPLSGMEMILEGKMIVKSLSRPCRSFKVNYVPFKPKLM